MLKKTRNRLIITAVYVIMALLTYGHTYWRIVDARDQYEEAPNKYG